MKIIRNKSENTITMHDGITPPMTIKIENVKTILENLFSDIPDIEEVSKDHAESGELSDGDIVINASTPFVAATALATAKLIPRDANTTRANIENAFAFIDECYDRYCEKLPPTANHDSWGGWSARAMLHDFLDRLIICKYMFSYYKDQLAGRDRSILEKSKSLSKIDDTTLVELAKEINGELVKRQSKQRPER